MTCALRQTVPGRLVPEGDRVAHADGVGQRSQLAVQCIAVHHCSGVLVPANLNHLSLYD